ncbi:MAG TPA: glycosyltransferase family 4 protein [Methylomirabilota bacterium]|jgi:glycosyltransferase involved in cell wall biosynthesis|nr:glycosyltransferase family 4 protein [Methylomirabilota bacterium]
MRALRLLHLVANRWWTGNAEPAVDLARALQARGHAVWFACVPGDALEEHARAAGLTVVPGLALERTARPWRLLGEVAAVRRVLRERRIDLVHAHQTHDHWIAALARGTQPARLVRSVHHRRAVHRDPGSAWLFGRTDAVIAVSDGIRARLRAVGVLEERLRLVPGAVDAARFPPELDGAAVRAELGLGDAPVVGCVARLVPGRGHDVLLHAVARLRARLPAVRLVLVGRGEHRPALETLVGALDLASTVVFAGYRGPDLPAMLAALDCVVLLGAGSEESCRAVLEAMAARRPVVAAPVGAVPETVVDGETGILVAPEADAVARAVEAVLRDPARARRLGEAGRRRVETLFTPVRRAERVEAVYARVLGIDATAG